MLLPCNVDAPDFTLQSLYDGQEEEVTLSSFKGKKVLLFFYPMKFEVVHSEFYHLEEKIALEGSKNLEIIAICTEPLESLKLFMQEERSDFENIRIHLASDLNGYVGKKYGIYKEDENKNFKALILLDEENKIMMMKKSEFLVGNCLNFEDSNNSPFLRTPLDY